MRHFTWLESPLAEANNVKLIAESGKHFYKTPDGETYPSITTVLYSKKSDSGLVKWRESVGPEVADFISGQAKQYGTSTHNAIDEYLKNNLNEKLNLVVKGHLEQLKPLLAKLDNIRAVEIPLYSKTLKIAGTCDCIAEHNGKLSIIDFKTSRKTKKLEWIEDYFIQASAYAMMWEEMGGEEIKQTIIMISSEEGDVSEYVKHPMRYRKQLEKKVREYYNASS